MIILSGGTAQVSHYNNDHMLTIWHWDGPIWVRMVGFEGDSWDLVTNSCSGLLTAFGFWWWSITTVVCSTRSMYLSTRMDRYDRIRCNLWCMMISSYSTGGNFNWLFFCGKRPLRFFPLLLSLIYFFRNSDKTEDNNRQTENLRRRTEENRTETAHHSSWEQLRSAKSEIGTPQAPPQELIRLSNHTL